MHTVVCGEGRCDCVPSGRVRPTDPGPGFACARKASLEDTLQMKPLLLETIATATAIVFTPIALKHARVGGSSRLQNAARSVASSGTNRPTAMSACTGSITAPSASCPYCPSSHRAQFGFINRLTHGLILVRALAMAVLGENYNALGCGSNPKSRQIDQ